MKQEACVIHVTSIKEVLYRKHYIELTNEPSVFEFINFTF